MKLTRPGRMMIGNGELALPAFFPSVSSVKTTLSPLYYVELLSSLVALNGQFLVSAFDLGQDSEQR